jgi:hypothetical protein
MNDPTNANKVGLLRTNHIKSSRSHSGGLGFVIPISERLQEHRAVFHEKRLLRWLESDRLNGRVAGS